MFFTVPFPLMFIVSSLFLLEFLLVSCSPKQVLNKFQNTLCLICVMFDEKLIISLERGYLSLTIIFLFSINGR